MSLTIGKRFGLLVTAVFLLIIGAWIWLVDYAKEHGDEPIPLPPRGQRP